MFRLGGRKALGEGLGEVWVEKQKGKLKGVDYIGESKKEKGNLGLKEGY